MFGTHDLLLFLVSGLLVCMYPGPDTLYIVGRSTTQGAGAGFTAALGVTCGILVHITAAALGLSAILATSATAFTVVKVVGAAYLVYVGISLIRSRPEQADARAATNPHRLRLGPIFFQGFLTDVLNVKVALFFLAFLPQFVDRDAPSTAAAFLFLGLLFNLIALAWNSLVAWSSARVGRSLARSTRVRTWISRIAGGLLIGTGVRIALTRNG